MLCEKLCLLSDSSASIGILSEILSSTQVERNERRNNNGDVMVVGIIDTYYNM